MVTTPAGGDKIPFSMTDQADTHGPEASKGRFGMRGLAALAVAATWALAVLLAIRPLSNPDLGYHLAYGEHFLDTGEVVDTNPFIYTLPPAGQAARPRPGPGCWYDQAGRYRFPNANWLTQVVMAAVHRLGGPDGLCVLQAALVAGIFAMCIVNMRQLGPVPWTWSAGAVLLMALTAYGRFNLRPELFGYLILSAQLYLLFRPGPRSGAHSPDARISRTGLSWPAAAALVALQLLLVNLHSYFLLGLALTSAVLADRAARLLWMRLLSRQADTQSALMRKQTFRVGLTLLAQAAVCFVNPWTWRLAALPVRTLIFMSGASFAGSGAASAGGHPWSHIGELFRPFAPGAFVGTKATYAYMCLLPVALAGSVAAAIKRKWSRLLVAVGMTLVSLSVRRNIALAAFIAAPVAVAALWQCLAALGGRLAPKTRRNLAGVAAAVIIIVATFFSLSVVKNNFYYNERSPWRFGLGISRLMVPLGPARWLNTHQPAGRMWTGFNGSSDWHYFTRPHRDVPILTNTWAYPPAVMQRVLDYGWGRVPFQQAVRDYSIEIVALRLGRTTGRLVAALSADANWKLVCLEGRHVVYLRADGPNAELARRFAITAESLDIAAYKAALAELDPVGHYATYIGGMTLYQMQWDSPAIELFRESLAHNDRDYGAWNTLGACLSRRGERRIRGRDHRGWKDLDDAVECFKHALDVRPDYVMARMNLGNVKRQIAALRQAVILR